MKEEREQSTAAEDGDKSAIIQAQQVATTLYEKDRVLLQTLKKALKRVGTDDYGICE